MNSSPGYCSLASCGTINADIFGWDGVGFDQSKLELVKQTVQARFIALLSGEEWSDPIKVFVKQEPHKLKKLEEGRYRLISAVSLVDNIIDRILFGWLGRNVLNSVLLTPCLVGWTPLKGGWRFLDRRFRGKRTLCLDKSAWDWTVPGWMVDVWKSVIMDLAYGAPNWWRVMVGLRFKLLFETPVFRFSDGTQVNQEVKGVMKSGCYLTIILNSLGQSILHYIAARRLGQDPFINQPYVVGDDTVQEDFDSEQYVSIIQSFGITVKQSKNDYVEFAGFAVANGTCYPAYWQKHLFNMAHSPVLPELLESYQVLYCNEPVMYNFICGVMREFCPSSELPKRSAKRIFNGL